MYSSPLTILVVFSGPSAVCEYLLGPWHNAAERLLDTEGQECLEGTSLGRVVWDRQRNISAKVLLGPRYWAGSSYRAGYAPAEIWTLQWLSVQKGVWWFQYRIYDELDPCWVCCLFLSCDSLSNDGYWCPSLSRDALLNYCLLINIWHKVISTASNLLAGCKNFQTLGG